MHPLVHRLAGLGNGVPPPCWHCGRERGPLAKHAGQCAAPGRLKSLTCGSYEGTAPGPFIAKDLERLSRGADERKRYLPTRASAAFKISALFAKPLHSSSDSSGCSTAITPVRPTMLGNDRVTPNAR